MKVLSKLLPIGTKFEAILSRHGSPIFIRGNVTENYVWVEGLDLSVKGDELTPLQFEILIPSMTELKIIN